MGTPVRSAMYSSTRCSRALPPSSVISSSFWAAVVPIVDSRELRVRMISRLMRSNAVSAWGEALWKPLWKMPSSHLSRSASASLRLRSLAIPRVMARPPTGTARAISGRPSMARQSVVLR